MVVGLPGQIGLTVIKSAVEDHKKGRGLVPSLPHPKTANLAWVPLKKLDHATNVAAVSSSVV